MKEVMPDGLPLALRGTDELDAMPLPRLVVFAGKHISARFQRVLDSEGISSVTGWVVLSGLAANDGLRLSDIAAACRVTPATLTGVVDTLERDALVTRVRDAADRRGVRIAITDAGRARVLRAQGHVAQEMRSVLPQLSGDDEAVVRRFLVTTIERLAADEPRGAG
jgi:MarR family transcriptional regulator, organic hydroperoxide resistance regulator